MMRTNHALLTLTLVAAFTIDAYGQRAAQPADGIRVECRNVEGVRIDAPTWRMTADASSDQILRLWFRGDTEPSTGTWFVEGIAESPLGPFFGIGVKLTTGFVILNIDSVGVETYTYDALTGDLLYSQARINSFGRSVKAFRGTCKPSPAER